MKRIIVVILALSLGLSFFGCGKNNSLEQFDEKTQQEKKPSGEYVFENEKVNNYQYAAYYHFWGNKFSITLPKGGINGTFSMNGSSVNCYATNGDTYTFTYDAENDTLFMSGKGFAVRND